jgi:hypothetical protein
MKTKTNLKAYVALLFAGSLAVRADPIPIKVTDPWKQYSDSVPECVSPDKTNFDDCTSTAYLSEKSLTGDDDQFKRDFDAWNDAQTDKWTLKDGKALPGGEFDVKVFEAEAYPDMGGLVIRIYWTYTGADKADFVWSQGYVANFLDTPLQIVPPFRSMDVKPGATSPVYPNQYADRHFFDRPLGPWPDSFFHAEAFLSKVDTTKRELTVYEGVGYGFDLRADPEQTYEDSPEPAAAIWLTTVGIVVVMVSRRVGRAART